jgi:hypothetical protein
MGGDALSSEADSELERAELGPYEKSRSVSATKPLEVSVILGTLQQ